MLRWNKRSRISSYLVVLLAGAAADLSFQEEKARLIEPPADPGVHVGTPFRSEAVKLETANQARAGRPRKIGMPQLRTDDFGSGCEGSNSGL